jgi:transcriptional regulator with XRE-family HTH domain
MVLLRHLLGDALRRLRLRQGRTLREVSASARVSLGYLSEVERGQKEASSELLAAICTALGTPLSQVLREVSDNFALAELQSEPVFADVIEPAIEVASGGHAPRRDGAPGQVPVGQVPVGPVAPATRVGTAVGAGVGASVGSSSVGASVGANASAKLAVRGGQLRPAQVPVGHVPVAQTVSVAAAPGLPIGAGLDDPVFDQVARVARQITDMVPV